MRSSLEGRRRWSEKDAGNHLGKPSSSDPELAFEFPFPEVRDSDRAAFSGTLDPAQLKQVISQG